MTRKYFRLFVVSTRKISSSLPRRLEIFFLISCLHRSSRCDDVDVVLQNFQISFALHSSVRCASKPRSVRFQVCPIISFPLCYLLLVVPKHHRRFHHHPRPHYGQWAGRSRVPLLLVACYNHFHHFFFFITRSLFSGCVLCFVVWLTHFSPEPATTLKKLKRKKTDYFRWMNFQFGLRESSDTFDVLALIMSHFFAISSTIHDGSDFFSFRTHLLHHTLSSLCRFYAAGSISVSSSHISLPCSFGVYLLLSIIFFSCVSHSPRSTASRCVGRSSPSFRRRRPFVVYHLPISSPFRKQSNLIHRMWTRMFASMCFFSYTWKSPTTAHNRAAARESSSKRNTRNNNKKNRHFLLLSPSSLIISHTLAFGRRYLF